VNVCLYAFVYALIFYITVIFGGYKGDAILLSWKVGWNEWFLYIYIYIYHIDFIDTWEILNLTTDQPVYVVETSLCNGILFM